MAKQTLNNGDTKLSFRTKCNENFTEVYDLKANLASPALTGIATVPTAAPGTNTTQIASTAFVTAAASTKANTSHNHTVSDITSGVLPIANGGTGFSALGTPFQVPRVNDTGTAFYWSDLGAAAMMNLGTTPLTVASGNDSRFGNASALTSGTVDPARLGSGSSITTKFLRGDSTWQTISGGGDALTTNPLSQFAATTSSQLAGVISDETGSGALVFANSPTLVTPALGTPTSGTLTNCTGLPIVAGTTGTLSVARGGTGTGTIGTAGQVLQVNAGATALEFATPTSNATHTGDVTGATILSIANDAVTYAKMQNVSAASRLLGRGDSGVGDVQEITLGSGLTMTGTTLSSSGGGGGLAEPLVMPSTVMPALAIDVTKWVNTKSINSNSTMTFSNATPTAGTRTEVRVTTDSTARTLTIPTCYSYARNASITSILIPASSSVALILEYTGSRWEIWGDPVQTTGTVGKYVLVDDATPPADGQTIKWIAASSKWAPADDLNSGGGGGSGDMLSLLTAPEIAVTTTATLSIGRMHVCSGTSANYTVTLPTVSGNTGRLVGVRMAPGLTRLVTVDANGSEVIDGQANRIMWANEAAILFCDGVTWTKVAGKPIPMTCVMKRDSNQTAIATATFTKVLLNNSVSDPTGLMANTGSSRVDLVRPGLYTVTTGVRWNSLTANGTRMSHFASPDGTIQHAYTEFSASFGTFPYIVSTENRTLAAGSFMELYCWHNTGANEAIYGHATNQSSMLQIVEVPLW